MKYQGGRFKEGQLTAWRKSCQLEEVKKKTADSLEEKLSAVFCGYDETRTRDLRRDRPAF
jgi:hypothetical protein